MFLKQCICATTVVSGFWMLLQPPLPYDWRLLRAESEQTELFCLFIAPLWNRVGCVCQIWYGRLVFILCTLHFSSHSTVLSVRRRHNVIYWMHFMQTKADCLRSRSSTVWQLHFVSREIFDCIGFSPTSTMQQQQEDNINWSANAYNNKRSIYGHTDVWNAHKLHVSQFARRPKIGRSRVERDFCICMKSKIDTFSLSRD